MKIETRARIILFLQGLLMVFVTAAPALEPGGFNFSLSPLSTHKLIGLVLNIGGFTLLVTSLCAMKASFEIRAKQRPSSKLITSWPFSWVRNPIYLAGTILSFGWSISFASYWGALGAMVLLFVIYSKIKIEESYLKIQFGAEYQQYVEKVPRFIPRALPWR